MELRIPYALFDVTADEFDVMYAQAAHAVFPMPGVARTRHEEPAGCGVLFAVEWLGGVTDLKLVPGAPCPPTTQGHIWAMAGALQWCTERIDPQVNPVEYQLANFELYTLWYALGHLQHTPMELTDLITGVDTAASALHRPA
jgi:hypothetical protein